MLLCLSDGVESVSQVGGKAAGLMKMHCSDKLSANVPSGFVLTIKFFEPWVKLVTSSSEWESCKSQLGDPGAEVLNTCEGLKELARSIALTTEQAACLTTLCKNIEKWDEGLCAVRSSAPEEDGREASFAGMFMTKLGVTASSLETAVRDCFVSIFDQRVFAYAKAQGARGALENLRFAAIVMEQVDAVVAGVAFSANPMSGCLDHMAVDSSWGLGESVVDGSVVADNFVFDRVSKEMLEKHLGTKSLMRTLGRAGNGGVEATPVEAEKQKEFSISEDQVEELSYLVAYVEELYGGPVDVEWAYNQGGKLLLLQCRPITTLHPLPEYMYTSPGEPKNLYADGTIIDGPTTHMALSRMDLSVLGGFYEAYFEPFLGKFNIPHDRDAIFFLYGARLYLNLNTLLTLPLITKIALKKVETMDFANLPLYLAIDRKVYRAKQSKQGLPYCWFLRYVFANWRNFYRLVCRLIAWRLKPEKHENTYNAVESDFFEHIEKLKARGPSNGFYAHITDLTRAYIRDLVYEDLGLLTVWVADLALMNEDRTNAKAGSQEREEYETLLNGHPGNIVMEMNTQMYELAKLLPKGTWDKYHGNLDELATIIEANLSGKASDLPKEFLDMWRAFIKRWGCRAFNEMSVSQPRYADEPLLLLRQLANCSHPGIKDPRIVQDAAIQKREELEKEMRARPRVFCKRRSGARYRSNEARMKVISGKRDNVKLHVAEVVYAQRVAIVQVADRFVKEGRLEAIDDIWLATMEELDNAVSDSNFSLKAAIEPHRAYWERAKKVREWPLVIDSRGHIPTVPLPKPEKEGALVGTPLSPGIAKGRVRVLHTPLERFESGEILAAVLTDPGWTPLFLAAGGIIMQIGGILQHGGVVARELGKPAVSGIRVAEQLKTGMLVQVDGNTGVVQILEERAAEPGEDGLHSPQTGGGSQEGGSGLVNRLPRSLVE